MTETTIPGLIKELVKQTFDSFSPANLILGVVEDINPLVINVEQRFKLTKDFLILTKNVIDYDVNVSVNWNTEKKVISNKHTHNSNADINVSSTITPNKDNLTIKNTVTSNINIKETNIDFTHSHEVMGTRKMTIHNALKIGDNVILIQVQGGQKYIVLDKVV